MPPKLHFLFAVSRHLVENEDMETGRTEEVWSAGSRADGLFSSLTLTTVTEENFAQSWGHGLS